jgi:hypothetical protein
MTEQGPDKLDKTMGPIFGGLLAIIWVALLYFIEQAIFSPQSLYRNPFIAWLNLGLVPFFVYAGNYLLYSRKVGGIETVRTVIALKSFFLCFLLWFPVLGVIHLGQYDIPDPVKQFGGFLLFLVVYPAWDWSATRRNPHTSAEQG